MTAVRKFELGPDGVAQPNSMIQVDKLLSNVNHRIYRQHMNYTCRVNLEDEGTTPVIDVYALMPSWYVMNALRTAKRVHDEAMKEERAAVGQARWYDFRIEPDLTLAESLKARGLDKSLANADVDRAGYEYVFSQVEDANGNARTFVLSSATSGSVYNVFEEYDAMGNISNDPVTIAAGGYDELHAGNEAENQVYLLSRGNSPPYNPTTWNVVWVKVGTLYRNAQGDASRSTGFFEAPLGVIYIPNHASVADQLSLEVKAGTYKGVQAVPI